jgi:hypothetical protein
MKIMNDIQLGVEAAGAAVTVLLEFSKEFVSMSHDI